MKRYLSPFGLAVLLLTIVAAPALAEGLRLPVVIGDHMVLQRDRPVNIWGWATPGESVTVSFKGQQVMAQANDAGKWRVALDAMEADADPAVMTVSSGDKTLTVNDILIGEVWLCSGQSNMEWFVQRAADANAEIAAANWPKIRHIATPHVPSMTPNDDADAAWEVCSPETINDWTAVGYYFGRKLHKELGVPIGLLNCTWGGTRIEPWTPIEGFAKVPELAELYKEVSIKQPGSDAYNNAATAYLESMADWLKKSRNTITTGGLISEPAAFPDALRPYSDRQDPTTLYNGQMSPFVPYTIRGSIWYQGESNRKDGMMYFYKTKAMLAGWRLKWENPGLPYYFVQIAPFQYGNDNAYELPALWEAQSRVEAEIDNTGMVVVSDIGNLQDIHPANKQDVGLRLANMALKRDYGYEDIIDTGPRFKSMKIEGSKVLITFDHAADGLKSRDGEALSWFELAGEDKPWNDATAKIVAPDTVELTSEKIDNPVAVRFGWHKLAEPNLMNSAGLPASPFRAGNPPKLDPMSLNVPESREYELVYEFEPGKDEGVTYNTDRSDALTKPFDRIAYFVELGDGTDAEHEWAYVSMDAFTDDIKKIGVPTFDSGATFQQAVTNMTVYSNTSGVPNTEGLAGHIEFWPNNYGTGNAANIPGATNQKYDTGDSMSTSQVDGYGSMQVHVTDPAVTVFAFNNWKNNPADLGIGNNTDTAGHPDWTFSKSEDRYTFKRIKVLIRPTE